MDEITIRKIERNSKKDSNYLDYIKSIQENFTEIPWINSVEHLYSELLFLYKESDFVSGITLFKVCPEETEISQKAKELFGEFIFASCLYTKPEYRNLGYGYQLLRHTISEVKSNGYRFIGIVDNKNQDLISSYRKNFSVQFFPVNSRVLFIEFMK